MEGQSVLALRHNLLCLTELSVQCLLPLLLLNVVPESVLPTGPLWLAPPSSTLKAHHKGKNSSGHFLSWLQGEECVGSQGAKVFLALLFGEIRATSHGHGSTLLTEHESSA